MSQPKRYTFKAHLFEGVAALAMIKTDCKDSFVYYSDYAALAAEHERLLGRVADLLKQVSAFRNLTDEERRGAK